MSIKNKIGVQVIKTTYIVYLGILYVFFGSLISILFKSLEDILFPQYDNLLDNFKKFPQKMSDSPDNMHLLYLTTITDITMVVMVAYLSRKIVKNIPFGFEGFYGFESSRVKEINGGIILAICIFTFFNRFKDKLIIYLNIWRVNKKAVLFLVLYIILLIAMLGLLPKLFIRFT
jgi:hypothetical protein